MPSRLILYLPDCYTILFKLTLGQLESPKLDLSSTPLLCFASSPSDCRHLPVPPQTTPFAPLRLAVCRASSVSSSLSPVITLNRELSRYRRSSFNPFRRSNT